MIIGITGSIGSGKTTAAKVFSKYWYRIINADEIAHEILGKNNIVQKRLINEFGRYILDKNKKINKKKLGEVVFNDAKKLNKLNLLMHPTIIKRIKNKIEKIKKECQYDAKIVIDAPLLLETKAKHLVDKIIVVKTDKKNIFKRVKKFPKEQIENILKHQMPLKEKLKHADFVIDNNKGIKYLENQTKKIIKELA